MPHKHKRRRDDNDLSNRDLPPSSVARALPAGKHSTSNPPTTKKRKRGNAVQDDTPKAFARIMQFQKTGQRSGGLDDGEISRKKRKQNKSRPAMAEGAMPKPKKEEPSLKIMPGERLSEFAARVNQALPLTGLNSKGKKLPGVKERRTRLEKKITKRQDEWRKDEEKRKEKIEEARDLAEEEEDEEDTYWESGGGRRSKRQRRQGDTGASFDDPWEKLKEAREKPRGVFDVVQAPPTFTKLPTEKFKVKKGTKEAIVDVPAASGSLRQRQELGDTRRNIIESYRRLMDGKRDHAIAT